MNGNFSFTHHLFAWPGFDLDGLTCQAKFGSDATPGQARKARATNFVPLLPVVAANTRRLFASRFLKSLPISTKI
jgi:hypothetical protein